MLATAAFTLLGVGGLLLVRLSLEREPPLRAATPAASFDESSPGRVEPQRQDLSEGMLVAAPPPRSGALAEVSPSEENAPVPVRLELEHADRKQLEEHLRRVWWGEGRHDEKLALLRGLARSTRADKLEWLAFAVANLSEQPTSKGPSLAVVALEEVAELAARESGARETLERLAFETEGLHVVLRRRAAALAAEGWPATDSETLRRRLRLEPDRTVASAMLEALDRRADEAGVREWLGDFADWRRPVEGEP